MGVCSKFRALQRVCYVQGRLRIAVHLIVCPITAQVKPADEEKHKWIHKLAVEPAYERASLSTSKIKLWQILRVQAVATYDWDTRRPGLQWR